MDVHTYISITYNTSLYSIQYVYKHLRIYNTCIDFYFTMALLLNHNTVTLHIHTSRHAAYSHMHTYMSDARTSSRGTTHGLKSATINLVLVVYRSVWVL